MLLPDRPKTAVVESDVHAARASDPGNRFAEFSAAIDIERLTTISLGGQHQIGSAMFQPATKSFFERYRTPKGELAAPGRTSIPQSERECGVFRGPQPEFVAALSEREAGSVAEADRLAAEVERSYAAWFARHPAASAQHAAEFLLERGDATAAHARALANAALRDDIGSRLLLARTAAAIGDAALACERLDSDRATGLSPPELHEVEQGLVHCDRRSGAR